MQDFTDDRRTGLRWALLAGVLLITANGGCGNKPAAPTPSTSGVVAPDRKLARPVAKRSSPVEKEPAAATGHPAESPMPVKQADEKVATAPQPIFRPSDTRPRHDDARLAALGIRVFESKRLKLYTDVDPELAAKIPPLIDAAYPAWEAYFGKLPPNRKRSGFQITGYLMSDKDPFQAAGLIPDDLRPFENGRHRGAEFWMNDQQYDYYRRHLAIHESTHCFMQAIAGERYYEDLPAWYWEGMAELFGTHRVDEDGRVRFRVMPGDRRQFAGLGRITMVRDAVEEGGGKSVADVAGLRAADFIGNDAYAWSWALCKLLDTHPAYQKQFRKLGSLLTGSRFIQAWRKFQVDQQGQLPAEWALFVDGLQYGYDVERAAVDFRPGRPLSEDPAQNKVEIPADRGWQSSALRIEEGKKYIITATGQFTLAAKPKPWVSEAGGISFDYFGGRPLGLLLARIHPAGQQMLPAFAVGRRHEFVAPASGTLYLRLNDSWSRLADNRGQVTVQVRRDATGSGEVNHGDTETRRGTEGELP